ncbi:thioredoxin family protein [Salibacterium halotolerans]|uniref:Thiol-disulfide isomerase or thioredoxin n=1 Tax=Salibacterium halotolerans TaxID=1884432 RepID=A0A1I5XYZ2_9BACI|nr:thioredoxin family protein [Salibacterium halotolerans]SFQ36947.1 Thiol-disulfide isomerase or thioredoxin [Salibacterium halotolerans]
MTQTIQELEQFQSTIASPDNVIIKFTAGWCPDCHRMDAFFPEVEEEFEQLPVYEINRDNFPDLAEQYEVMGIPSLLVFKDGEKIGHLHSADAKTPEQTTEFLSSYFS